MTKPISKAHSPVIRNSQELLKKAALRAREVAQVTGTKLVIEEDGVTKLVSPKQLDAWNPAEQLK